MGERERVLLASRAEQLNAQGLQANEGGEPARAFELFLAAHREQPDRACYLISAANMALKIGQYPKAVELYALSQSLRLTEKQVSPHLFERPCKSSAYPRQPWHAGVHGADQAG